MATPYDGAVLILLALVVLAVVVIVIVGRSNGSGNEVATTVTGVEPDGLRLAGDPAPLTPWNDVWQIAVITRRGVRSTWYGFELRTDHHGLVTIDGSSGLGQRFLSESHRFERFDHTGLGDALTSRKARAVCFIR